MQKKRAEILSWAQQYAEENGWVLNPDTVQLDAVIRGLVRNQMRKGERYCPCRIMTGEPEADTAIICPCRYHTDEIASDGHCHCNLFFNES
ncbi:ferredoxin-thioredoxin reductase catalytic subunit [Methanocalculus alkaliphilus]|uniref:ferredoxin-thioredoxin reductase catalytic domain-containing protein n=1 Tax=Methanocalculus alkaliphilus TaxID=768730 RepID=UPI00209DEA09|nr:ferredoxin-thioredoxin reductase catalytic domain-containing protein [Methanocalculus alkaliphilus]MCP1714280.1 ferredoxin-thioredoxin reductase catalytic subunit [Methanocalculus alkaliphilus]